MKSPLRKLQKVTTPHAAMAMAAISVAVLSGWLSASVGDQHTPVAAATFGKRQPPVADTPTANPRKKTRLDTAQDLDGHADPLLADQELEITPTALHRFQKVEVLLPDGNIQADGRPLKIRGLALPPRTKTCRRPNGQRWACGLRAIVALHNLVAHSSMVCEFSGTIPNPARCKIGPIDVAATMLRNGWAELAPDTKDDIYIEAQAEAQAARAGIWSNGEVGH